MGASYVSRYDASSPHTRRYFQARALLTRLRGLFSAHAEVFPAGAGPAGPRGPLLRTRGGISLGDLAALVQPASSPHTRRYFLLAAIDWRFALLFSAHAEVFPC